VPVGEMDLGQIVRALMRIGGQVWPATLVCSRSSRPVNWSARLATSLCASWQGSGILEGKRRLCKINHRVLADDLRQLAVLVGGMAGRPDASRRLGRGCVV
jgi:hypothetical protein